MDSGGVISTFPAPTLKGVCISSYALASNSPLPAAKPPQKSTQGAEGKMEQESGRRADDEKMRREAQRHNRQPARAELHRCGEDAEAERAQQRRPAGPHQRQYHATRHVAG